MENAKRLRQQQAQHQRAHAAQAHDMDRMSAKQLVVLLGDEDFPTTSAAYEMLLARGKFTLDALIDGLNYSSGKVRASCALLMDHLGDDRCTEPLMRILKTDPLEAVRRCALHSLACQNCKALPLQADIILPILEAALSDRSKQVRRRAIQYLVGQPSDQRVVEAMDILIAQINQSNDPIFLERAKRARDWHIQPHESVPICVRQAP